MDAKDVVISGGGSAGPRVEPSGRPIVAAVYPQHPPEKPLQPTERTKLVMVCPVWTQRPTRWLLRADEDGPPLREQIARWLWLTPKSLHAVAPFSGATEFLDQPVSVLPRRVLLVLSLRPITPSLATGYIARPSVPPTEPGGGGADDPDQPADVLGRLAPLTPDEKQMVETVMRLGVSPLPQETLKNPVELLPERGFAPPQEALHIVTATDVSEENQATLDAVVTALWDNRAHAEVVAQQPSHNYRLRQELHLAWERTDVTSMTWVTSYLEGLAQHLTKERATTTAYLPAMYLRPYVNLASRSSVMGEVAKRCHWLASCALKTGGQQNVAEALSEALACAHSLTRGFEAAGAPPSRGLAVFSTSSSASLVSPDDLFQGCLLAEGVSQCVDGVFVEPGIDMTQCHNDALAILGQVGLTGHGDPEFDPLSAFAEKVASPWAGLFHECLSQEVSSRRRYPNISRRSELNAFLAVRRLAANAEDHIARLPALEAYRRQVLWELASRIREKVEQAYLRHVSGEGGRNVASFELMLRFLGYHLGGQGNQYEGLTEQARRPAQFLAERRAWLAGAVDRELSDLERSYRKLLFNGLLRMLLPCTRSTVGADLALKIQNLLNALSANHFLEYLVPVVGAGGLALPAEMLAALRRLVERVSKLRDDVVESSRSQRDLLMAGTTIILDTRNLELSSLWREAETRAKVAWQGWVRAQGQPAWMSLGSAALMTRDDKGGLDRLENPFEPVPGRIFQKLLGAVGREAGRLAAQGTGGAGMPPVDQVVEQLLSLIRPALDANAIAECEQRVPGSGPTAAQRSTLVVVAGVVPGSTVGVHADLKTRLTALAGLEFSKLEWIEAHGALGVHFFRETHAIPLAAIM